MDDVIRLGSVTLTIPGELDTAEAIAGEARMNYWIAVGRLMRRIAWEASEPATIAMITEAKAKLHVLGIAEPGREKAPALLPPSFAGERLDAKGRETLHWAAAIQAAAIKTANLTMAPTAIARETALLLRELALPIARPASIEVIWRAARMPVSATGEPFADPATGTITSRFPPAMLAACRQDIETRFGPILEWTETPIAAIPVAQRNAPLEHEPDHPVYRQVKRLLRDHDLPATEAQIISGTEGR
jgi:hypothetical protein